MPFEIRTTRHFAAAHQLRLYDGSLETLHGHNWKVEVTVAAAQLDSIGVVMDFHELEKQIDSIIAPLHNHHLNDTKEFQSLNPSTENVAWHFAQLLKLPANLRLKTVEIWETPDNSAVYHPE